MLELIKDELEFKLYKKRFSYLLNESTRLSQFATAILYI